MSAKRTTQKRMTKKGTPPVAQHSKRRRTASAEAQRRMRARKNTIGRANAGVTLRKSAKRTAVKGAAGATRKNGRVVRSSKAGKQMPSSRRKGR